MAHSEDEDPPTLQLANLTFHDEAFNPDMHSPNEMMIDGEEHIVDPVTALDEKDSLAIITPENLEIEGDQLQDLPVATDCTWRPLCVMGMLLGCIGTGRLADTVPSQCDEGNRPPTAGRGAPDSRRSGIHMDGGGMAKSSQEGAWAFVRGRRLPLVSGTPRGI